MTTKSQTWTTGSTWTAPPFLLGGSVQFQAFGGPGGFRGGHGGEVSGSIPVTPGSTVLTVDPLRCLPGDAAAGGSLGGHGAAILNGTTVLAVAGGGGGGGGSGGAFDAGFGGIGGISPSSGTVGKATSGFGSEQGGGAATLSGGGFGGSAGPGIPGGNGSSLHGGTSGAGSGVNAVLLGGGSGGGGYFGGGGGQGGQGFGSGFQGSGGGGGGGGQSFVAANILNPNFVDGGSTLFASITFTWTEADVPLAPTLLTPAQGAFVDSQNAGVTFTFQPNPGTNSGPMNAYALRVKLAGGNYQYWNGTDFTSTSPVWNSANPQTSSVTIPAHLLADGSSYSWSVATQESNYNLQGAFANDFTFTATVQPTIQFTSPVGATGGAYGQGPFGAGGYGSGTGIVVTTPNVLVAWQDTLAPGATQSTFRGVIYTLAQTKSTRFSPGGSVGVFDTGLQTSNLTSFTITSGLANQQTFVIYVQITDSNGVPSLWTSLTFTLEMDGPAIPMLTAMPGADPVTGCPITTLTASSNDNLLSVDDSTFESTLGDWTGIGCTAVRSSAWAVDQTWSLLATSLGASAVSEITTAIGVSAVAIQPNQLITLMAVVRGQGALFGTAFLDATQFPFAPASEFNNVGTTASIQVTYYDVNGNSLGSTIVDTEPLTLAGTQLIGTTTTPRTGVAYASVQILVQTPGPGIKFWVDAVGLFYGNVTVWTIGGFVGKVVYEYQYCDDQGVEVNWFDVRNGLDIVPQTPVIDYESPFNQPRFYRVRAIGATLGQQVYSLWSIVQSTQLNSDRYWFVDPLNPGLDTNGFPGALVIWRTSSRLGSTARGIRVTHEVEQIEQQGTFQTFGRTSTVLVRGDLYDESFQMAMLFDSLTYWEQFDAMRKRRTTICMRSDLPGKLHYMAFGPNRPRDLYSMVDRNKPSSISEVIIQCIPQDKP